MSILSVLRRQISPAKAVAAPPAPAVAQPRRAPRHVAIVPAWRANAAVDAKAAGQALASAIDGCLKAEVVCLSVKVDDDLAVAFTDALCTGGAAWTRGGVRFVVSGAAENGVGRRLADAAAALESTNSPILTVRLALNSSGRAELVSAMRRLAAEAAEGVGRSPLTTEKLEQALSTRGVPPVDLMIHTGGRRCINDFLLWQSAYAELLYVDASWGDFDRESFSHAMADYAGRCRKFGALVNA